MFKWDESIDRIDVKAGDVVQLFRSMRDVQLALPGLSAQQAVAYLCQYKQPEGIATVAVFHLHKSGVMAFYCSDPRVVPEKKMAAMLDEGLNFVESMGFLLTDQDIHLLNKAERQALWESLPLHTGPGREKESPAPAQAKSSAVATAEKSVAAAAAAGPAAAKEKVAAATEAGSKPATKPAAKAEPTPEVAPQAAEEDKTPESVDDLLAAVEALRANRPGLRARKIAPTAEEMKSRKEQLRVTVGRILATL